MGPLLLVGSKETNIIPSSESAEQLVGMSEATETSTSDAARGFGRHGVGERESAGQESEGEDFGYQRHGACPKVLDLGCF